MHEVIYTFIKILFFCLWQHQKEIFFLFNGFALFLYIYFLYSYHLPIFLFTFLKTELTGVTPVTETMQVSSVQPHNTQSAYGVVHSPPKIQSPSATIYLPLPSSTSPIPHSLWHLSYKIFFWLTGKKVTSLV